MTVAYIGLGSNLGDRLASLVAAVRSLAAAEGIEHVRSSPVYETDPVGGPAQADYLNAVVEVSTTLPARALLELLQAMERALGRMPRRRWGPREIDLDLLLFGQEVIDEPDLRVPHPELVRRAFVLVPLADLAAHVPVPGAGAVAELLARVDASGIRPAFGAQTLRPD